AVNLGVEACDDGNTASGDGCLGDCSAIEPEGVSDSVGAYNLTVTTDTESGDGATPSDPVETTVAVPYGTTAGSVSISEGAAPPAAPAGFNFLGTLVETDAT